MPKEELLRQLEALIKEENGLVIWIHGNRCDYVAPAVSVCMNGLDVQIEVSPDWKLDSAEPEDGA